MVEHAWCKSRKIDVDVVKRMDAQQSCGAGESPVSGVYLELQK